LYLNNNLQVFSAGTQSYIEEIGSGSFYIKTNGSGIYFEKYGSNEKLAYLNTDGSVELYYDNSKKFETTGAGATVFGTLSANTLEVVGVTTISGDIKLGDNDKITFGAGDDLRIFHDGSHSYIRDLGTGILRIETDGSSIGLRKTSGESMGVFNTDGSVDLYYDNSKKFETTNNGVSVTGTITATDFNSTSDIIRKKNLREVVNSLEILKDIRGVRFDWIENGSPSVGVIAQEVEQVLPELVNENDGIKSVNYNGLVGVLIEAVKELQAEVEGLKRTR